MKTNQIALFFISIVFLGLASCQNNNEKNELAVYKQKEVMETKNIELAKKSLKYLDTSDYDSLSMICTENFKVYLNTNMEPMYLNDFKPLHKMFYTAFPDYSHKIENVFASGDYVVFQVLLSGTHKNEFQGIAPTNKKIEYKGIQIIQIKEGKLEAVYAVDDNLTMMTQIGFELN